MTMGTLTTICHVLYLFYGTQVKTFHYNYFLQYFLSSGMKRRWTVSEDQILKESFQIFLTEKRMPPGATLKRVVEEKLTGRTVAQVRTKINNIIHDKQKFC